MEGNWNGAQGNNKYQYNEKEWNDDFGLGWNHHDWRFFDVAINRFVTIDPEGETGEQRSWNPYHFSFDNPIRYSDPDGRTPIAPIVLRAIGRYALKRVIRVALATPKPTPAMVRELNEAGCIHASTIQRDATTVVVRPIVLEVSKKDKEKQQKKEEEKAAKKEEQGKDVSNPTPADVVPANVRKSNSWHDNYSGYTVSELKEMAQKGDKKAQQMKKLTEQHERLTEKKNKH